MSVLALTLLSNVKTKMEILSILGAFSVCINVIWLRKLLIFQTITAVCLVSCSFIGWKINFIGYVLFWIWICYLRFALVGCCYIMVITSLYFFMMMTAGHDLFCSSHKFFDRSFIFFKNNNFVRFLSVIYLMNFDIYANT